MKTGIFEDWGLEKYLAHPATSQRWLSNATLRSVRFAEYERKRPFIIKDYHLIGRLFEDMVQDPERLGKKYLEVPGLWKCTTAAERQKVMDAAYDPEVFAGGEDAPKKFHNLYHGVQRVIKKDFVVEGWSKTCAAMVEHCRKDKIIEDLFWNSEAKYQVSMIARFGAAGLFRGRADTIIPVTALNDWTRERLCQFHNGFLDDQYTILVDIKTANDWNFGRFVYDARNKDYPFQLTFYRNLWIKLTGTPTISVLIVVQKPGKEELEAQGFDSVESGVYVIGKKTETECTKRIQDGLRLHERCLRNGLESEARVGEL